MLGSAQTKLPPLTLTSWVKGTSSFQVAQTSSEEWSEHIFPNYALLAWHCTFGLYITRVIYALFAYFVQEVFARKILPTGKLHAFWPLVHFDRTWLKGTGIEYIDDSHVSRPSDSPSDFLCGWWGCWREGGGRKGSAINPASVRANSIQSDLLSLQLLRKMILYASNINKIGT